MGVLAAEDRRPAGRAEGRRAERVDEVHPFVRKAVDVGRFDVGVAGTAEGVPPKVVAEHDDDVRAVGGGGGLTGQQEHENQKDGH